MIFNRLLRKLLGNPAGRESRHHEAISPERKFLLRLALLLIAVVMLFILFAPGKGIFRQQRLSKELDELSKQNEKLAKDNQELKEEIARLQNDENYQEEIARKKYGMLKENEMVFEFDEKKK